MTGFVARKGERWYVVTEDGRDEQGRRKRKWHSGYRTKREAREALTDVLGRARRGSYVEPSRESLGAFLVEWMAATRATIRPVTHESYRRIVDKHIVPALGGVALQAVSGARLNAFYAELMTSGLGSRTVRYTHAILHKALGDAVRWDRVARNAADAADPPKATTTETLTWTPQEVRQFLAHVQGDRLYALWLLTATTGMRRAELLGLRWQDVDLEAGHVSIRQTRVPVGSRAQSSEPKTAKGRRRIDLDAATVAALREHRRRQAEERLAWRPAYEDADLVFCRENGTGIDPSWLSKAFPSRARAAGNPRIRLHDLRHTWATLALEAGVHPKIVSERLGHSTVAFTLDRYSHAIPALEKEAGERVAGLIFDRAVENG